MPPFVVEGLTDAVFFRELVRSHYPNAIVGRSEEPEKRRIPDSIRATKPDGSELFLEFRNQNPYDPDQSGGRRRVHVAVRGLIRAGGVVQLAAAKDLNGDTPEAVVESLEGELRIL